jgi:polyhydroxyalkanoate synthesis regulator protein
MQEFFGNYLERSVSTFVDQQEDFQKQLLEMVQNNPMTDLAKRNLELCNELHGMFCSDWSRAPQKKNRTRKTIDNSLKILL